MLRSLAMVSRGGAEASLDGGHRAVARVLDILETLSGRPAGASLTELSVTLEAPKTSLLPLLRTLVSRGYAARGDSGRYGIGPRWLEAGRQGRRRAGPGRGRAPGAAGAHPRDRRDHLRGGAAARPRGPGLRGQGGEPAAHPLQRGAGRAAPALLHRHRLRALRLPRARAGASTSCARCRSRATHGGRRRAAICSAAASTPSTPRAWR